MFSETVKAKAQGADYESSDGTEDMTIGLHTPVSSGSGLLWSTQG